MKYFLYIVIVIFCSIMYVKNKNYEKSIYSIENRLNKLEDRVGKSEKLIFIDRKVKEEIINFIQ